MIKLNLQTRPKFKKEVITLRKFLNERIGDIDCQPVGQRLDTTPGPKKERVSQVPSQMVLILVRLQYVNHQIIHKDLTMNPLMEDIEKDIPLIMLNQKESKDLK